MLLALRRLVVTDPHPHGWRRRYVRRIGCRWSATNRPGERMKNGFLELGGVVERRNW